MPAAPGLDDQLCFALYSASMAIGRAYKPMLDRLGITYPQYLVLGTLWEEDGRNVGTIATRLGLEPSTVTPLVKRLEAAGLVTRRRNASDERQVFVSLTDGGQAMQEKSQCLGETLVAASRMSLDDIAELNDRLKTFRTAVSDHAHRGTEGPETTSGAPPRRQARRKSGG